MCERLSVTLSVKRNLVI